MAIQGPTNFACNKTSAAPGEMLTFTWTEATGEFDFYRLYTIDTNGGPANSTYIADKSAKAFQKAFPQEAQSGQIVKFAICAYAGGLADGEPSYVTGMGPVSYLDILCSAPVVITPPAPSTITVGNAVRGQSVTVSWSAVSGTPTYTLQRSINGGTFTDVYTGPGLSYSDTVGDTWTSVQYRVKAAADGNSSSWTLSAVKTVQEPPKPVISGHLVQLENEEAEKVYPKTTTDGVFRHGDGKTLESILEELQNASSGGVTLEQVNEAIQEAVLASWGKSYG